MPNKLEPTLKNLLECTEGYKFIGPNRRKDVIGRDLQLFFGSRSSESFQAFFPVTYRALAYKNGDSDDSKD